MVGTGETEAPGEPDAGDELPDPSGEAPEDEESIPTVGGDEETGDPEALADQILEENQEDPESGDDEFSLEDFDISEFDDLPEQSRAGGEGADDAQSGDGDTPDR